MPPTVESQASVWYVHPPGSEHSPEVSAQCPHRSGFGVSHRSGSVAYSPATFGNRAKKLPASARALVRYVVSSSGENAVTLFQ